MLRDRRAFQKVLIVGIVCYMASSMLQADEKEDLKRELEYQKEIAELRRQIAEADKAAALASKEAATSRITGSYADAAAISESKSQIATQEANKQFAELTALKSIMGDPKKIGVDGSIAFSSDTQNIMLQSRQGGIQVTRDAAAAICAALRGNKNVTAVVGEGEKLIVPLSEQRLGEIVAAKLRMMRVQALLAAVQEASRATSTPSLGFPDIPSSLEFFKSMQIAPLGLPGAIVAAQQAQYLLQGVDNVAGALRVNRTFTMDTTARADLFESRLAVCSDIFLPLSLARSADRRRLDDLVEDFTEILQILQAFAAGVAVERKQYDSKPEASKSDTKNDEIKGREALAARINGLSYTDDILLQDLALASMEQDIQGQPIMTYSLSIQDVQVLKERFLLSNKLSYQGTAEVVYQVTDPDGRILDGDAVSLTSDAYDVASTKSVKDTASTRRIKPVSNK